MKRSNVKEDNVVKGDKFIFPCANGMIKSAGTDSVVRTSKHIRQGPEEVQEHSSDHPGEEDDKSDLAEEQQDAMEAKNDIWSISGSFIYRHHVQEVQELYVLSRELFSFFR